MVELPPCNIFHEWRVDPPKKKRLESNGMNQRVGSLVFTFIPITIETSEAFLLENDEFLWVCTIQCCESKQRPFHEMTPYEHIIFNCVVRASLFKLFHKLLWDVVNRACVIRILVLLDFMSTTVYFVSFYVEYDICVEQDKDVEGHWLLERRGRQ